MMELGATVCLPRNPACTPCPIAIHCAAHRMGIAALLPAKMKRQRKEVIRYSIALAIRQDPVLLLQRASGDQCLGAFWELPTLEQVPGFRIRESIGTVRHAITFNEFHVEVVSGTVRTIPAGARWLALDQLAGFPVTTLSLKP